MSKINEIISPVWNGLKACLVQGVPFGPKKGIILVLTKMMKNKVVLE